MQVQYLLAVYSREIIDGFVLEEKSLKMKAVYGLGRTNYGGLQNVGRPVIDPQVSNQELESETAETILKW